mgnify:CR=1 FL=1|tara:strand:- start:2307 stop:2918 length:612 start_codon:yes stop_codon:yes gene_type:complete
MAILTVGGLALVAHSAGGAILSYGGSYLGGTYVGANIVTAFGSAAGVLSQMSVAAASVVSAPATVPVLATAVTIAVVAAGAYCYLNGIPAPVAEMLSTAGVGSMGAKGLAIPVAKLAPALIALGVAGYLAYVVYKDFKAFHADYQTRAANPTGDIEIDADAYPFAFNPEGERRHSWWAWLISAFLSLLGRKPRAETPVSRRLT